MARKTSAEIATIAARVLGGGKPSWMPDEYFEQTLKPLAASCLSQDETPAEPSEPSSPP